MKDTAWRQPGDPALFRGDPRDMDARGPDGPGAVPPGVYKHVSSRSAHALREVWEQATFDAFYVRLKDRR